MRDVNTITGYLIAVRFNKPIKGLTTTRVSSLSHDVQVKKAMDNSMGGEFSLIFLELFGSSGRVRIDYTGHD